MTHNKNARNFIHLFHANYRYSSAKLIFSKYFSSNFQYFNPKKKAENLTKIIKLIIHLEKKCNLCTYCKNAYRIISNKKKIIQFKILFKILNIYRNYGKIR